MMPQSRHKEWRKVAKRERRRRIRTERAKKRDGFDDLDQNSEEYLQWLKEQELFELMDTEHVQKMNAIENAKWLAAEEVSKQQWKHLQEHKERVRMQQLENEIKLKLEWEKEKERKRLEEERLREIEAENKRKQEIFMKHLENFLSGDTVEPPQELLISRETKPSCEPCPFFSKTACCRFGDQCSRNHRYPGISKVLLATNFFSHFGLENANDFDGDIMLEFEDSDTYKEYTEFFHDVVPEFEKFGKIIQFKVCNNYEKHLRGNTYVEFEELRCAVAAYRSLHTRWYGGKQLSLQFCLITSWKSAICGLQSRRRCPKGRSCNFLHVFRNPKNLFNSFRDTNQESEQLRRRTPTRSWRWSESPEREIRVRRNRSKSKERREKRRKEKDYFDDIDDRHHNNSKDNKRHSHRRRQNSDRSDRKKT